MYACFPSTFLFPSDLYLGGGGWGERRRRREGLPSSSSSSSSSSSTTSYQEAQLDLLPSAMLCRILHFRLKHIFSRARFLNLGPSGPVT